ncbi:MAG: hypothetical protein OEZ00_08525, partial [Dehalococcoidia bacterium]|nr:hypothetical protein [Dehalococcoidia bacterium]
MDGNLKNCQEHLLVELKRIEMKLRLQAGKLRAEAGQSRGDKFHDFYISEGEVDAIIASPPGISGEKLSLHQGQLLRLPVLQRLFQLSAFEIDALLVCILPELDLRYQKLYGYLQDDITKKSPTVDLLLHLLCESFEQRAIARRAFLPEAPLMKYHLLRLHNDYIPGRTPLPAESLQIDERITGYLLGIEQ